MLVLEIAAGILVAVFILRFMRVIFLAASSFLILCIALAAISAAFAFISASNDALYLTIGIILFAGFCWWTHNPKWHQRTDKLV